MRTKDFDETMIKPTTENRLEGANFFQNMLWSSQVFKKNARK